MNAVRHGGAFLGMAGGALHLGDFGGMRKIVDGSVAVFAAENPVDATRVSRRPDRDVLTLFGFHAGLRVAGKASFVLFQRLRRGFLSRGSLGMSVQENYKDKRKECEPTEVQCTLRIYCQHVKTQRYRYTASSRLFETEIGQNLGIFFLYGQQIVASRAIVRDCLTVRTRVASIVATETAREVVVT